MFKIGDKVKCINTKYCNGRLLFGQTYIIDDIDISGELKLADTPSWWSPSRFELVEEKPQFDLKKNPWFIRTGTKEKSEAAQKWLFEQGVYWSGPIEQVIMNFDEEYIVNVTGNGDVEDYLMWCRYSSPHKSAKEIILEFETTVKSVTYPVVETEPLETAQDKKIKELKETIDKAQQQLEEMMGNR